MIVTGFPLSPLRRFRVVDIYDLGRDAAHFFCFLSWQVFRDVTLNLHAEVEKMVIWFPPKNSTLSCEFSCWDFAARFDGVKGGLGSLDFLIP